MRAFDITFSARYSSDDRLPVLARNTTPLAPRPTAEITFRVLKSSDFTLSFWLVLLSFMVIFLTLKCSFVMLNCL